jgi:drug/metabolite transporter (DMT)-like permease
MNLSLKSFTPNIVALSTLLEPVFAAVLALMIFQEALSAQMIFAAVLIVAGLTAVMSAKIAEPELLQEAL